MIEVTAEPRKLALNQPTELNIRLANVGTGTCTDIRLVWQIPVELVLLQGQRQCRIARLAPGDVCDLPPFRLQARKRGAHLICASSFTYRDPRGMPIEAAPVEIPLLVEPAPAATMVFAPELALTWQQPLLIRERWSVLRGELCNVGWNRACQIQVSLSGQVECTAVLIQEVAGNTTVAFDVRVCPKAAGVAVPVVWEVTYEDGSGLGGALRLEADLAVEEPSTHTGPVFVGGDWLAPGAKKVGGDEISGAGQKGDRVEIQRAAAGGVSHAFCSHCGQPLPPDGRFCPSCGQRTA